MWRSDGGGPAELLSIVVIGLGLAACSDDPRDDGAGVGGTRAGGGQQPQVFETDGGRRGLGQVDAATICVPGGFDNGEFVFPDCPDAGGPPPADNGPPQQGADAAVSQDAAIAPDGGPPDGAGPPSDGCGDAPVKLCPVGLAMGVLPADLEWSMPSFGGDHNEISMQPIVTQVDDDGVPDIVVIGSGEDNDIYLYGISGDGSGLVLNRRVSGLGFASGLAAGDIDGDGHVEIVGTTGDGVIAFSHTGTQEWQTGNVYAQIGGYNTPAIADMDGDGSPEVTCGFIILNADGTTRTAISSTNATSSLRTSVPADVDGDGVMELVTGIGVFHLDGTPMWSDDTSKGGYVAVANFDADTTPEIVVVGDGAIRLLDAESGTEHWSVPHLPSSTNFSGGPPVVADFDGDGEPEVGTQGLAEYTMVDGDGSVMWTLPIQENSAFSGSIAFDFDADGSAELVQADTSAVRIVSGVDGSVRFEAPRTSATGKQSVTVADIDGDGRAELVVPFDYFAATRHGIDVYGHSTWAAAEPSWNQYDYTITNIDRDGTVPTSVPPFWLDHNTFRAAGPPAAGMREPCGCQTAPE